jgi:hypothetical protein
MTVPFLYGLRFLVLIYLHLEASLWLYVPSYITHYNDAHIKVSVCNQISQIHFPSILPMGQPVKGVLRADFPCVISGLFYSLVFIKCIRFHHVLCTQSA